MTHTPEQVRHWLTRIPELAWWLPRALITRTPNTEGSNTHTKPGSRLPFRADIVDLLDQRLHLDRIQNPAWADPEQIGLLPYLHGWARDLAFELTDRDGTPPWTPARPTIRTTCLWLRRHLAFAATLPQWPELADGIGYAHARVEAATRAVRDDAPQHLVTCGTCHQGHLHPLSDTEWRCDQCQRYIHIRAVTIPEAACIAAWPERTLRHWTKTEHHRFPRVEVDGRRYFDLAQLLTRIAEAKLAQHRTSTQPTVRHLVPLPTRGDRRPHKSTPQDPTRNA